MPPDPIRQLPALPVVHRHIGQLLRELRLARRLLKLTQTVNDHLIAEATRNGLTLTTGDKLREVARD